MKTKRFHGVTPPLVTPLLSDGRLDVAALHRVVNHVVEGGVHGIFVLGSTGEGPHLGDALRREVITEAVAAVQQRAPVLVGVSDSSPANSVALAAHAADAGADAVVACPPFYYPLSQDDLLGYYEKLSAAVALPLMLYNIPSLARNELGVPLVARLSEHDNIVGVKDSSGDMSYFRELLDAVAGREDFSVFMGIEENAAEAVAAGADGVVGGGANVFPRLHSRLFEAARAGSDAPELLSKVVQRIAGEIYTVTDRSCRFVATIKAALAEAGLCGDTLAGPFHSLDDHERTLLRTRLASLASTEVDGVLDVLALMPAIQAAENAAS